MKVGPHGRYLALLKIAQENLDVTTALCETNLIHFFCVAVAEFHHDAITGNLREEDVLVYAQKKRFVLRNIRLFKSTTLNDISPLLYDRL